MNERVVLAVVCRRYNPTYALDHPSRTCTAVNSNPSAKYSSYSRTLGLARRDSYAVSYAVSPNNEWNEFFMEEGWVCGAIVCI